MQEVLCSKQPPICRKCSGMVILSFFLSSTSTSSIFLRGRLRGQSVLAVGRHSLMHVLGWHINCKCVGGICNNFYWHKQEFIKRFLDYCYLCRDGCMFEMYSHTLWFLFMSASDTSIPCMWTWLASSFIPHPYIFLISANLLINSCAYRCVSIL